jgi:hypothetical protein
VPRSRAPLRALGSNLARPRVKLVDNPVTNPTGASELRFAVAIHEAGHTVVFAFLRFDVPYVEMGLGPNPSGRAHGREIPWTDRIDYVATIHAGNVAVEVLCGGYRLPVVANPASDEAQLARVETELDASDFEKGQAPVRARQIVQACRDELVAIANALLASPNGRLEGQSLEALLTPVWAKPRL